jgi:hypothetical protein
VIARSYTWTSSQIASTLRGTREQVQIHMPQQKSESFRLRLQVTNESSAAPVRLTGLSLQVQAKAGQFKFGGGRPPAAGV